MKKPPGDAESSEAKGEETLRSLRGVPSRSRVALIIRHAAREEGAADSSEETWQLTPQGRVDAHEFGTKIPPFAHLFVTHTRVARTRDTAEKIATGFRERHPDLHVEMEGVDPALGLTSFYARDLVLRDHWREKLGMQFYHGWLGGQIPPNVLAPVGEAVTDLVERFHSKIGRIPESSLLLAVSHDVFVFAIRGVLFGGRAKDWPWIGYLDGVLLDWDLAGHLVARWRDETVRRGLS
jgi:Histidine phosphatase superfamily (branch 1)